MLIDRVADYNLKEITLVSSLPDMGRVGGLVTSHLAEVLKAKPAAKIKMSDKPWVNQKDRLISLPSDEYEVFIDEKNSLVIFTGQNQPQESSTVIELSDAVLSYASSIGKIKLVISTGGYLPIESSEDKVFGVATNSSALDILKKMSIPKLRDEVGSITWFNGLILGKAKQQGIEGIGLFGEIQDTDTPQFAAASNIIKVIGKILDLEIQTDKLDSNIIEQSSQPTKNSPGVG